MRLRHSSLMLFTTALHMRVLLTNNVIEDPENNKQIGEDFSESRFSKSRSNGENETVFDDILRLNYIALRAFHMGTVHDIYVPSYEYLVHNTQNIKCVPKDPSYDCWNGCGRKGGSCPGACGDAGYCCRKGSPDCEPAMIDAAHAKHYSCVKCKSTNGTLLQEVSEGDMLLDEKDHIVMKKSVVRQKKDVKLFQNEENNTNDDEDSHDEGDSQTNDGFGSEIPGPLNTDNEDNSTVDTRTDVFTHHQPRGVRKKKNFFPFSSKIKKFARRFRQGTERKRNRTLKKNRTEVRKSPPDSSSYKRVVDYFAPSLGNRTKQPEEKVEGADIDIPNATPFGRKLWVSRVVPYFISHEGTRRWSPAKLENKIIGLMNFISAISCVKFRPNRTEDNNYLHIYSGTGCYAGVGRKYWIKKGRTLMSLGDWCLQDNIILHLLLHVLGFFHENNRPDRDSFVNVDTDEIVPSMRREFRRHFQYDFTNQYTPYDYRSIMHYGENAYDARPNFDLSYTITNKFDRNEPLGGDVLTKYNILTINKLYHCSAYYEEANITVNEEGVSPWTAWSISCLAIEGRGCVRLRQRSCLSEDLSVCPTVDKFGVEDQFKTCDPSLCEVELRIPHWSSWEPVTPPCSVSCGRGLWKQTRKCDNPPPPDIGNYTCAGHNHRAGICRVHKCEPDRFDTDFEDGWGTWSTNFQFRTQWVIAQGPSKVNYTGAHSDHTFGNASGHYALLAARDPFKHVRQIGELISEPIDTSEGPKCVVFHFLMNGRTVRSLSAYIRLNNKYHKVWTRAGHQGNYWHRGAFTIPQLNSSGLYVVIDGVTGLAHTSDIALDDFLLNDGECPVGIEGCYDYFSECRDWRREGLCITQFDILIFSCCKTCQYEEYKGNEGRIRIGKDYHTVNNEDNEEG